MTILMFGSSKGGVTKTTTALNLAVCLLHKGKKVVVVKTDKNADVMNWRQRRHDNELTEIPIIEAYGDVRQELQRLQKLADIVIVDCAGYDNQEYRYSLLTADIFITPVKPGPKVEADSLRDVSATITKAMQGNPGLRPYVLFSRVKPRKVQHKIELTKFLNESQDVLKPLKTYISDLDIFEECINYGIGVHEVEKASSLGKAKAQIELMAHELGLLP